MAAAVLVVIGGALLPLAIHQRGLGFTDWITATPLIERVKAMPSDFISNPARYVPADSIVWVMKLLTAALVGSGLVLSLRARDRERAAWVD